ncbi:MAG: PGPGW domain-containing protein [Planctomycetota bacterium]
MDAPQITESSGSSDTPPAEQHPILPLGSWMWKQARKLVVAVIGTTVLLIGIIMMVAPGPAFIVIPCGLAILGTEFVWAKRLLAYAKQRVQELTQSSSPPDPPSEK